MGSVGYDIFPGETFSNFVKTEAWEHFQADSLLQWQHTIWLVSYLHFISAPQWKGKFKGKWIGQSVCFTYSAEGFSLAVQIRIQYPTDSLTSPSEGRGQNYGLDASVFFGSGP